MTPMEIELHSPGHGATPADPTGNGWYCGSRAKQPKPEWPWCTLRAGFKTDHPKIGRCHLHGGKTESHNQAAEAVILRREADRLGVPREVDAGEAFVELVHEAAGNVEFYRQLVAELPVHPSADKLMFTDGEPHWERGDPGIYAPTRHQSGIPTGEAKRHILVQMYDDERDRLANYVASAVRAGVEERRVRLAERDATVLQEAQIETLKAMGLADRLEEFHREFGGRLRALTAGIPAALSAGGSS